MQIPVAFILLVPAVLNGQFGGPSEMAKAPSTELRMKAFHDALSRYELSDPALQQGVIELMNRETNDPSGAI